jgi:hypothetical protein
VGTYCGGLLRPPSGKRPYACTAVGSTIVFENAPTNIVDFGYTGPDFWIITGAFLHDDPGGTVSFGKRLTEINIYVNYYTQNAYAGGNEGFWEFNIFTGDEESYNTYVAPPVTDTVSFHGEHYASQLRSYYTGDSDVYYQWKPETVWTHKPTQCTGRTFMLEVKHSPGTEAIAVIDVSRFAFRGYGGIWLPGPVSRHIRSDVNEE